MMRLYDLAKLADPDILEHLAMRDAYMDAGRPLICPCCGGEHSGLRLPLCTVPGWNHWETCAMYRYARDVCVHCAARLAADLAAL